MFGCGSQCDPFAVAEGTGEEAGLWAGDWQDFWENPGKRYFQRMWPVLKGLEPDAEDIQGGEIILWLFTLRFTALLSKSYYNCS